MSSGHRKPDLGCRELSGELDVPGCDTGSGAPALAVLGGVGSFLGFAAASLRNDFAAEEPALPAACTQNSVWLEAGSWQRLAIFSGGEWSMALIQSTTQVPKPHMSTDSTTHARDALSTRARASSLCGNCSQAKASSRRGSCNLASGPARRARAHSSGKRPTRAAAGVGPAGAAASRASPTGSEAAAAASTPPSARLPGGPSAPAGAGAVAGITVGRRSEWLPGGPSWASSPSFAFCFVALLWIKLEPCSRRAAYEQVSGVLRVQAGCEEASGDLQASTRGRASKKAATRIVHA
mmetsp:Transcript_124598/g.347001  ORF Transcript_124598/g.347001 Transcript_124598/m.347001 type:complete len:294 (+) Transcript_124598:712-1593(+)